LEAGERYAASVYEANVAEMKKEFEGLDPTSKKALIVNSRLPEETRALAYTRANARHSNAVRVIHERAASRRWLPLPPEPPMPR
jgi:hypothetical protein